MRFFNVCIFVFCILFVAAQTVLAAEEDEWITIKKKDLCPALHKEAMCTDNLIDFGKVAQSIAKLDKNGTISGDQVDSSQKASKCGDPLKEALCSEDARLICLEDRTSGDDKAEKRVCNEFYRKCPSLAEQKSLDYTEECAAYLKRQYSDITCETVGADFKEGGCPRPERRMPEFYVQVYQTQSDLMKPLDDILRFLNPLVDNVDVWDEKCLKTVREVGCMPIYCSNEDQGIVQMKNKRNDCSRAMECVSKATQKLESLTGDLAKGLADELRDFVKNSCETVIKSFEDLANSSSDMDKNTGEVSAVEFSISFALVMALLTCLNMFV